MVEEGTVEELRLELGEKAKMIEKLKCDGVEKAKMIEKLKCDGVEMEHKLSSSRMEMEMLKISLEDKIGKLEAAEAKLTKLCNAQEKARGILIEALEIVDEIQEKVEEVV
nr:hypothetical protein Itr_chr14CG19580 [Ipomoea trifida]GMD84214.1 hypothetical protein Iba_chr14aCG12550 [Ipomoea batatas]GME06323.1 hypothetical protein Iba_scaffold3997CG0240 [Ipomoea batatas]